MRTGTEGVRPILRDLDHGLAPAVVDVFSLRRAVVHLDIGGLAEAGRQDGSEEEYPLRIVVPLYHYYFDLGHPAQALDGLHDQVDAQDERLLPRDSLVLGRALGCSSAQVVGVEEVITSRGKESSFLHFFSGNNSSASAVCARCAAQSSSRPSRPRPCPRASSPMNFRASERKRSVNL